MKPTVMSANHQCCTCVEESRTKALPRLREGELMIAWLRQMRKELFGRWRESP